MEDMMKWFLDTLTSSIGKKMLMALTGIGFSSFLIVHLIGNLNLYIGGDAFNAYAKFLHSMGPLVIAVDTGLILLGFIHVLTGLTLFYQNFSARPSRYKVNKSAGGRTIGSATMPYTGLIMLGFILLHLTNFTFADTSTTTIYQIIVNTFANPIYSGIYIAAMIVVAIHISHGLWSAFQTFGLNHPKYNPLIKGTALLLSVVFGIGFGFIPVFIMFMA